MEPIESSETSAYNNTLTPGTYPKEKKLQSKHGESLKSSINGTYVPDVILCNIYNFSSGIVFATRETSSMRAAKTFTFRCYKYSNVTSDIKYTCTLQSCCVSVRDFRLHPKKLFLLWR